MLKICNDTMTTVNPHALVHNDRHLTTLHKKPASSQQMAERDAKETNNGNETRTKFILLFIVSYLRENEIFLNGRTFYINNMPTKLSFFSKLKVLLRGRNSK